MFQGVDKESLQFYKLADWVISFRQNVCTTSVFRVLRNQ